MDLQHEQKQLLHAYRMAVRGGLTSREQILTLDMSSLRGIGPVRGQLLKDAAATCTDEEWATSFPHLAGAQLDPEPVNRQAHGRYTHGEVVDERVAYVLDMRHGLLDGRRHTYVEIAKSLNVTGGRIEQIYKRTVYRLRILARMKEEGFSLTETARHDLERYRFILDEALPPARREHKETPQPRFCQNCGQPLRKRQRKYCSMRCNRKDWERRQRLSNVPRTPKLPLSEREKYVLDKYYGLGGMRVHMLKELGVEFGVTKGMVSYIARRAVEKVRLMGELEKQGKLSSQAQQEDLAKYRSILEGQRKRPSL